MGELKYISSRSMIHIVAFSYCNILWHYVLLHRRLHMIFNATGTFYCIATLVLLTLLQYMPSASLLSSYWKPHISQTLQSIISNSLLSLKFVGFHNQVLCLFFGCLLTHRTRKNMLVLQLSTFKYLLQTLEMALKFLFYQHSGVH